MQTEINEAHSLIPIEAAEVKSQLTKQQLQLIDRRHSLFDATHAIGAQNPLSPSWQIIRLVSDEMAQLHLKDRLESLHEVQDAFNDVTKERHPMRTLAEILELKTLIGVDPLDKQSVERRSQLGQVHAGKELRIWPYYPGAKNPGIGTELFSELDRMSSLPNGELRSLLLLSGTKGVSGPEEARREELTMDYLRQTLGSRSNADIIEEFKPALKVRP